MSELLPLIAHRGASAFAPENTLAAFKMAAEQGAGWIECDAKLTRDNKVILFHDDELSRTSNGKGAVKDQNWSFIQGLDAGGWFGPPYIGEPIPLLESAINCWIKLGLKANIEIKPCPGRDLETAAIIMEELQRTWPKSKELPLISSFSVSALREAKQQAPQFSRGLLLEDYPPDWLKTAKELEVFSIHCWDEKLTEEWTRQIKQAGYHLLVYTVNSPDIAKKLFSWGVDSIFTDRPGELRVVL